MNSLANSVEVGALALEHIQFDVLLRILPDDSFRTAGDGRLMENDFLLPGGQLREHLLVLLLALPGQLGGGFFAHSNDYYKRHHKSEYLQPQSMQNTTVKSPIT